MVIWFRAGGRPRTEPSITWRDVGLHADDRFHPGLLRFFLETPGRVEVTVVSDRKRWLLELERALYQVIDPVRSVQQRILGVTMQMNEGHRTGNIATPVGRRKARRDRSRPLK